MTIQDVTQDKVFWLHGGKTIKNIPELARELRNMNNETFSHYVNEQKNDFANWIQHCIKDEQLATLARTTKNKERMLAIIERRIQEITALPKQQQPTIHTKNTTPPKRSYEPTIIRTHNKTQLIVAEQPKKIIHSPNKTQLKLHHEEPKKEIIRSTNKTELKLLHEEPKKEIYVHEIKPHHHSATMYISYLVLGIVVGVALAALSMLIT